MVLALAAAASAQPVITATPASVSFTYQIGAALHRECIISGDGQRTCGTDFGTASAEDAGAVVDLHIACAVRPWDCE